MTPGPIDGSSTGGGARLLRLPCSGRPDALLSVAEKYPEATLSDTDFGLWYSPSSPSAQHQNQALRRSSWGVLPQAEGSIKAGNWASTTSGYGTCSTVWSTPTASV